MNRVTAPISPDTPPEAPMSGAKSMGALAQYASPLKIAVTAMKMRNRAGPKRRATGGPNATSQMVLSMTWVHEPCRKA